MIKVLVLEDSEERIVEFKKRFASKLHIDVAVVYVDNVEDFKTQMLENKPELILLDHDLGGQVYVSSSKEDTGAEAVRFIVKNFTLKDFPFPIIIHSLNGPGSDYMFDLLMENKFHAIKAKFLWSEKVFNKFVV